MEAGSTWFAQQNDDRTDVSGCRRSRELEFHIEITLRPAGITPGGAFLMVPPTPAGAALALAMSVLGQKQTLERASKMSALPPKADIFGVGVHVR